MSRSRGGRREERRQMRETRRMDAARRERRGQRQAIIFWVLIGVVVVVGIGALAYSALKGTAEKRVGRQLALEPPSHVAEGTPITHGQNPPASGVHFGVTKPWGVYEEAVSEGYWVHNLEHGGIAILYNCPEACPDLVEKLREVYRTLPPSRSFGVVKLLVTPYSNMEHKLAIVAWEWIDEMDAFDRDRLLKFYEAHIDRGPESLAN